MKKKLAVLLGAGALTMAALCGCGATTEQVVDKMFDQDAKSFAMNMDMDVDVSAGISGMSIDLSVGGTMEAEVDNSDEDAPASHVTLDVKASAMGSSQKVKTESYVITDDDEVATYVKDPDSGDWTVTRAEGEENPLDKKTREKIIDEVKDVIKGAELQKKTEKKEGEDCYVLKLNTTADAFEGVIDVMWDALGDDVTDEISDAGADKKTIVKYLSYFNIDSTFYASKKNGYLVAMDLDLAESDTDGLIKQAGKDFGDMTSALGVDLDSISLDISALSFNLTFSDWDDAEVELPKDVKNNAVEAGGFDFGGDDFGGDDDDDDDDNMWDGGDDNGGDDNDDDDDDDGTSTSNTDLTINSDGSISLYDYYGNFIADVKPMKGYSLEEDWSSNNYLMYSDDNWSYYSVGSSAFSNWNDVVDKGDTYEEEGCTCYLYEDTDTTYVLADLGFTYNGSTVYAAARGTYNEDTESLDSPQYYIVFDYGDGWCEVCLDASKAENWEWEDFEDAFDEIFK